MKLVATVVPQIRHVLTHGRFFTPSVVILFAGLEMFGRRATSDMHDTVGAVVLLLILSGIAFRHRSNPIPWVKWLGGKVWLVARFFDRFKFDLGPDLRGTPRIKPALPTPFYYIACLLVAWIAAACSVWYLSPGGWRPYAVNILYIGYLALMSVLWGMLFVAALGSIYFPSMLISRLSGHSRSGESKMSRGQLIFLGLYLGFTISAAWFLPLWPMLCFFALFWVSIVIFNLRQNVEARPQLIWRKPNTRKVRSIPVPRMFIAFATLIVLLLVALIMSSAGGNVFEQIQLDNTMPLTTLIGTWLAWMSPGLLVSIAIFSYLSWRNDPARIDYQTAHLEDIPMAARKSVIEKFQKRGWIAKFDQSRSDDVHLRLVPPDNSELREFDPKWPLAVGFIDLENPILYERMSRRDVIQRRRHLLRGLERLFSEAKSQSYDSGCGFWLAPHLWFVAGLTRDEIARGEDEPAFLTEIIGSPYNEVFTSAVRRYTYRLLKGLQVDLIFVEDGVGYKKLARVMRTLFEITDKSDGNRRAEDVHFQGMTKIRVLFHEFDIDEPFRSNVYPEPKFAPLGRLRVLHIFRDRGDQEDLVEPPFNFDETPAPSLVGV